MRQSDDEAVPEYLQSLFEKATAKRSKVEARAINKLLHDFQDVFSKHENDLGFIHLVEHRINTGDAVPIKLPPWKIAHAFADKDRQQLEKLKSKKVIQPSTSLWAALLVLVWKKDGSTRICVDYRRLNAVTEDDAFPIPRTQDCLDAVAGATLFSIMDITSAYHQIPVAPEDVQKTAFVTKYGLFEFKTMPFGLKTAPATYQRLMELALSGLQWTSYLIYLDDVIVFGKTFDEHLGRLAAVLQRFHEAGLKLKPEKCNFFKTEVKFIGYVLTPEGVLPDLENVKKILQWPEPKNVTDIRGLLGMGNYYSRFIRGYSEKV